MKESTEAIQKNNAHKSVDTQLIYQEGHNLPFDDAPIQFTADQIGGGLSRLVTTNLKIGSWCSAIGVQLVSIMATSLVDGGPSGIEPLTSTLPVLRGKTLSN